MQNLINTKILKVCQALREGAPEIRRQMIASSKRNAHREKENSVNGIEQSTSRVPCAAYHFQHHDERHPEEDH